VLRKEEITKIADCARDKISIATEYADRFVRLCDLLAMPENHITIKKEPHMPARTITEMVNEMAQELSNLPRFTAYSKVLQVSGQMGEIQLTRKEKIRTRIPTSL
jgi:hypothetical protein